VELIRAISKGRTLVIVEHDMGVVFDLADRISVLVYGETIATDTPGAIRENAAGKGRHTSGLPSMLEVRDLHAYYGQEPHPPRRDVQRGRRRDREPPRPQRRRPHRPTIKTIMGEVRPGRDHLQGRGASTACKTHEVAPSRPGLRPREPRHLPDAHRAREPAPRPEDR
jgi:hypothetical protein